MSLFHLPTPKEVEEPPRGWKLKNGPTTCGRRLLKAIKTSGVMARPDTTVGGQRPTPAATCSVNSPICRRSRQAVINSTKRAHGATRLCTSVLTAAGGRTAFRCVNYRLIVSNLLGQNCMFAL